MVVPVAATTSLTAWVSCAHFDATWHAGVMCAANGAIGRSSIEPDLSRAATDRAQLLREGCSAAYKGRFGCVRPSSCTSGCTSGCASVALPVRTTVQRRAIAIATVDAAESAATVASRYRLTQCLRRQRPPERQNDVVCQARIAATAPFGLTMSKQASDQQDRETQREQCAQSSNFSFDFPSEVTSDVGSTFSDPRIFCCHK